MTNNEKIRKMIDGYVDVGTAAVRHMTVTTDLYRELNRQIGAGDWLVFKCVNDPSDEDVERFRQTFNNTVCMLLDAESTFKCLKNTVKERLLSD
jgi:hypothetical protein